MDNNEPCTIIIFGATGDLANRKLMPAFYRLEFDGLLHKESRIIAFARKEKSNEDFRNDAYESIREFSKAKIKDDVWGRLAGKLFYHNSNFHDANGYKELKKLIEKVCPRKSDSNKIFYIAAPSSLFNIIIDNLKKSNLASGKGWSRIAFEKPFGHDLKSAKKLNMVIRKAFEETQIYSIDHYLGKELVQNLLVLRFANGIFDPLWNKKYIDHVQITVAEDMGIGSRGAYYDKAGALRDMVQNHMMQLLSLVAMEPPVSLDADDVREEKVKVLRSVRYFSEKDVKNIAVRGQYGPGTVNNEKIKSYRQEDEVAKNSNTETFVALKLNVDNWRWSDVPFYLRTGKRLKERVAEIAIVFKQNPSVLFSKHAASIEPNMLIIRIQPAEGISLQCSSKVPGRKMIMDNVRMDFCHECTFGPNTPDAYERLLLDIIIGDQTLFARWDETEYAWKIVDKIAANWKRSKKVPIYEAGAWGPKEAEEFIKKDGRKWAEPKTPMYTALLQGNIK